MARAGRIRLDGGDGRRVRAVQCGGVRAAASASGDLEQHVVFAFGLRGDQLHQKLGVCRFRGGRIVGRCISFDDAAAKARECFHGEEHLEREISPSRDFLGE